jgi:hypothetical protein
MRRAIVWLLPGVLALGLAFPGLVLADAPTADAVPSATGLEDQVLTVHLSGDDADGDPLSFSAATGPTHGLLGSAYNVSCSGDTQTPPSHCTADIDYTPTSNYAGLDSFTYVTNDGVSDSAAAEVDISLTGVNDPPTFSNAGSKAANEDTAASFPGWVTTSSPGGGSDESTQTISYNVSNVSNPTLFSTPPAVSNAGTLTWTPAANAFGTSTVDITAQDTGGTANFGDDTSAPSTITITVNSVNDAPSFTGGGDEGVNEDSGAASFPAWATNPVVGPTNESTQTYSYVISSNSNPSLFGTAPAVATNGTLSFTPAANRYGTATIGVRIQDNGGSLNGGVDISPEQTMVITVTNVDDPPNAVNDVHVPIGESAPATAINVLANDTWLPDPVETLTITAVTQGAHGTVVITGGGTGLTYQPAALYVGSDQFTYTIQDSGGVATDQGTVQVDVAKDTTAPTITSMGQSLRTGTAFSSTSIPIRIAWAGSDGTGVGIKSYQLQRSVDGGTYTTITLATVLTTSYSSTVTPGHTYRFRVRATDKNGNVGLYRYSVTFKGAIYQDTATLGYVGTWAKSSSTSYSGGTTHYTGIAGRSVSLTTSMRDIAFVGPVSSTRGGATIYVDNVLIGSTINEKSSSTLYRRVLWAMHFSSLGTHTIRIVVSGTGRLDIDAFLVLR